MIIVDSDETWGLGCTAGERVALFDIRVIGTDAPPYICRSHPLIISQQIKIKEISIKKICEQKLVVFHTPYFSCLLTESLHQNK